jgi:hypothetical protein
MMIFLDSINTLVSYDGKVVYAPPPSSSSSSPVLCQTTGPKPLPK